MLTIAGFFTNRVPVLGQYELAFKIVGIALLVLGVYFRGGVAVEQEWRERVAAVEAQLAIAEKASAAANAQIETRTQQQVAQIRQRMTYVRQYVDREIVRYNDQCQIPEPFIRAHNDAAEVPKK